MRVVTVVTDGHSSIEGDVKNKKKKKKGKGDEMLRYLTEKAIRWCFSKFSKKKIKEISIFVLVY